MSVCTLYGTLINASEEGLEGVTVQFIPKVTPVIRSDTGKAVLPRTIEATTTSTGYFEADIFIDMDVVVIIKSIGIRETIRVPDLESKNVFELIGVYVSGDPTPSDSGENDW